MSEWGRVVFYFDYELNNLDIYGYSEEDTRRYRGVISRAYKYPGIYGLIRHGIDGFTYFLERHNDSSIDFDGIRNYLNIGMAGDDLPELNTAFDVLWDIRDIRQGVDSIDSIVKTVLNGEAPDLSKMDDMNLEYDMFACEGTDGYFYMTYTGNPKDGYVSKYGYYCGYATVNDKLMDARKAVSIDLIHRKFAEEKIEELLKDEFFDYIDQNFEMFKSEEEFWAVEDLGAEWIRDLQKKVMQDREEEKRIEKERQRRKELIQNRKEYLKNGLDPLKDENLEELLDEHHMFVLLRLSSGCRFRLKKSKIFTIRDLLEKINSEDGLETIENMNETYISEIMEAMIELGLL